jgi:putative pantetheine hydrolase
LLEQGVGFPVGIVPGHVVPIVPAAVIFDLGRGGEFAHAPDAELGRAALAAAGVEVGEGTVGAGTGARVGGLKGGVGSTSARLDDGSTVGALVVVNAVGSALDLRSGEVYGARHCRPGDLPSMRRPDPAELRAARERAAAEPQPQPPLATTLAVVATDATLTKAQCRKVSGIGHDGLARGISPVHTMFDGDAVFTLATGAAAAPGPEGFHALLTEAADCVTRAIARAVVAAESAGGMRCCREAFPSAFA